MQSSRNRIAHSNADSQNNAYGSVDLQRAAVRGFGMGAPADFSAGAGNNQPAGQPGAVNPGAYSQAPGAAPQWQSAPAPYGASQPAHAAPPQYGVAQAYVPPITSQPVQAPKRKRGKGFWIGIIIAIVALIAAAILAYTMLVAQPASKRAGDLGQLEGKTPEEIQAELNRIVDEGMFNISIASQANFKDGQSEGELRIENVPGNRYLMQVTITRDDNGQQIYESGVLEPNYHIQSDRLDVDLPKGQYLCTANFRALDPETEDEIGTAAAQIIIVVES